MKKILLPLLMASSSILLFACGDDVPVVPMKSDPQAHIYLGGKLPGVSEEMMKDEKISVTTTLAAISVFSGSESSLQGEGNRLISAMPEFTPDSEKMISLLNAKVLAEDIAGYRYEPPAMLVIYSKHGIPAIMILSAFGDLNK